MPPHAWPLSGPVGGEGIHRDGILGDAVRHLCLTVDHGFVVGSWLNLVTLYSFSPYFAPSGSIFFVAISVLSLLYVSSECTSCLII